MCVTHCTFQLTFTNFVLAFVYEFSSVFLLILTVGSSRAVIVSSCLLLFHSILQLVFVFSSSTQYKNNKFSVSYL